MKNSVNQTIEYTINGSNNSQSDGVIDNIREKVINNMQKLVTSYSQPRANACISNGWLCMHSQAFAYYLSPSHGYHLSHRRFGCCWSRSLFIVYWYTGIFDMHSLVDRILSLTAAAARSIRQQNKQQCTAHSSSSSRSCCCCCCLCCAPLFSLPAAKSCEKA